MTAACATCRELLGGYVLGALDPAEAEEVSRHLAECSECAHEHARLAPLPRALDAVGSPDLALERPPATLEEAVLDRFAREKGPAERSAQDERADEPASAARRRLSPRRLFTRPLPAALGGVALGAIVAVVVFALTGPSSNPAPHEFGARLAGAGNVPQAKAYAKLRRAGTAGTHVRLYVRGLPAGHGEIYELWCLGEGKTRWSAGTFRADARGRVNVELTTAARLGEYHRLSVERRQPGQARGERVMAGAILY